MPLPPLPKRAPKERIKPNPRRRAPNGYCADCGIRVKGRGAMRCVPCARKAFNRTKPGTFTSGSASAAAARLWARRRAEHAAYQAQQDELERLRDRLKWLAPGAAV